MEILGARMGDGRGDFDWTIGFQENMFKLLMGNELTLPDQFGQNGLAVGGFLSFGLSELVYFQQLRQ